MPDPSEELEVYRRHLPHWRLKYAVYFVTWRLRPTSRPLEAGERTLVSEALEHFHSERYRLLAYVVMDDHVHVLVTLLGEVTLQEVVHSWKSFTANLLQRMWDRRGAIWQGEYLDRIVRDPMELHRAAEYLANNPVKRWPETT